MTGKRFAESLAAALTGACVLSGAASAQTAGLAVMGGGSAQLVQEQAYHGVSKTGASRENNVNVYRGPTALLGDEPAGDSGYLEREIKIKTAASCCCRKFRRLRTQGFYSGNRYPSRRYTQGFYSGN